MKKFLYVTLLVGIHSYIFSQNPPPAEQMDNLVDNLQAIQGRLHDACFSFAYALNMSQDCAEQLSLFKGTSRENFTQELQDACTTIDNSPANFDELQQEFSKSCKALAHTLTENLVSIKTNGYTQETRNCAISQLQEVRDTLERNSNKTFADIKQSLEAARVITNKIEQFTLHLVDWEKSCLDGSFFSLNRSLFFANKADSELSSLLRKYNALRMKLSRLILIYANYQLRQSNTEDGLDNILDSFGDLNNMFNFPSVRYLDKLHPCIKYKVEYSFRTAYQEVMQTFCNKLAVGTLEAHSKASDNEGASLENLVKSAKKQVDRAAEELGNPQRAIVKEWDKLVEERIWLLKEVDLQEKTFRLPQVKPVLRLFKVCYVLSRTPLLESNSLEDLELIARQAQKYLHEGNLAMYESLVDFIAGFLDQTSENSTKAAKEMTESRQHLSPAQDPDSSQVSASTSSSSTSVHTGQTPSHLPGATNESDLAKIGSSNPNFGSSFEDASTHFAPPSSGPDNDRDSLARKQPKLSHQEESPFSVRNLCILLGAGALSYYGYTRYWQSPKKASSESTPAGVVS